MPMPRPLPTSLPRTTWSLPLLALVLSGCASHAPVSAPRTEGPSLPAPSPRTPAYERDGPLPDVPPNLMQLPDAEPRLEPIRKGGPNKPYDALGQHYEPMTEDQPLTEKGLASWYGRKFHGKPTSSGEVYNMYAMTGAHATMPIPSYARVRNPANGREVIVRINDRGPFHPGRVIDLSYTAALKLDLLRGVAPVEVERITYEDIRTGAWLREGGTRLAQAQPAPVEPAATASPPVTPQVLAATRLPAPLLQSQTPPAPAAAAEPTATATGPVAQTDPLDSKLEQLGAAPKAASRGFWVQLGAFARLDGAENLRRRLAAELDWTAPLLAIFRDAGLHRLQAGPYASRDDARQAAERLRLALSLNPVVVERR